MWNKIDSHTHTIDSGKIKGAGIFLFMLEKFSKKMRTR